jgi:hypothetical protein
MMAGESDCNDKAERKETNETNHDQPDEAGKPIGEVSVQLSSKWSLRLWNTPPASTSIAEPTHSRPLIAVHLLAPFEYVFDGAIIIAHQDARKKQAGSRGNDMGSYVRDEVSGQGIAPSKFNQICPGGGR